MSALVPHNFGAVSSVFQTAPLVDDLSSGIQSSFGLIGYKGKVWSIKYRGDEFPLMREDGDGPRNSIEVVVLKASPNISKIWYEQGYVEGSSAAPDCFSNNGVTPEASSVKKQASACAMCPHNQWGSRITPAGKQGKSCADSKRIAVVPASDLLNEAYGGPLLLRVPAASLQDLAMYGQKMNQMGYPYFSIATKISFDAEEAYPKFIFGALRPLNDAEGAIVMQERDGHTVGRILSESEFTPAVGPSPAADDKPLFEQAPDVGPRTSTAPAAKVETVGDAARAAAAQTGPQTTKPATTRKAAAPAVKPVEEVKVAEPEVVEETDDEREEREMEEKLAAMKAAKLDKAAAAAKAAKEPETIEAAAQPALDLEPSAPADQQNMVSDFEADLDSMLDALIPKK